MNNVVFKKISIKEFEKLKGLAFKNNDSWELFKNEKIRQLNDNLIDIYVIECNNDFVGRLIVNYVNTNLPSETILNRRVYLSHFILDEKYRKQGLGQKLLNFVFEDLKRRGYSEFTVGVEEKNLIGKHIYNKYGFNEVIDRSSKPFEYTLYIKRTK